MNSLSIRVQPRRPTTRRAISDPPDAYWRVIVTSGFTADEGCVGDLRRLREQVGTCSWAAGPFSERGFLLSTRPHVAELLAARDPLLGHEPFEHELARRDHRRGILLAREPHLIDQREQTGDNGEAFEERLGALVGRDLEGAALIEPVDDVVHVGAAHAALERAARRAANQVLGDRL